jgi:biopolymer transport protein ExbD
MTPLIDVLLVLLIIFMVITPRREQTLPVSSPAPGSNEAAPEALLLAVANDLGLELNSKTITAVDLQSVLSDLMKQRSREERSLIIKAPPHIPYDPVVGLIDLAKGCGVITVGLVQGEIMDRRR